MKHLHLHLLNRFNALRKASELRLSRTISKWLIKSINLRTQSNLLLLGCRINELKNSILECLVWLLWTTNTSHSLIQHTQYTPMNTHMDVVRISISLIRICPHHMMIQLYEMCIFRICGVYCMLCIYLYI